MESMFSRSELLFGSERMERLRGARVAVFGLGGVGGYVVEALARAGIGSLDLTDADVISVSNINRQILATSGTIGMYKADAAAERVTDINPDIIVRTHKTFFSPETSGLFDFSLYDYVVDAIDTVTGKIELAVKTSGYGIPEISSMGAGNKMDPTKFEVADIYSTSVCPLARVMRRELRRRGIKSLKVVYSREVPVSTATFSETSHKPIPGSNSFVPPVAGLIIAGEVIKDISGWTGS